MHQAFPILGVADKRGFHQDGRHLGPDQDIKGGLFISYLFYRPEFSVQGLMQVLPDVMGQPGGFIELGVQHQVLYIFCRSPILFVEVAFSRAATRTDSSSEARFRRGQIPLGQRVGAGVDMNGQEEVGLLGVGNGRSFLQGNKTIGFAGHKGLEF